METSNQLGSVYSNPNEGGCWGLRPECSDPGYILKVDQGYAQKPTGSAGLPLQSRLRSWGLESWSRSTSSVRQSTFPFMPVTSHVAMATLS